MESEIIELLKELNLSDKEIKIYTHLVQNDKLTVYQIAKETHLHRSNCYNLLDKLTEKGFVEETILNDKKLYQIKNISNVLGKLKNTESILFKLNSELEQTPKREKTIVSHMESKGAFSQFNMKLFDLVKNKKIEYIYVIGDCPELTTKISRMFIEKLLKEIKDVGKIKKLDTRAIWEKRLKNHPFVKQFRKFTKNKFLPKLSNRATTFIYGDQVSFVFLEKDQEQVVEIKSKNICEEMKLYFEYLWEQAE